MKLLIATPLYPPEVGGPATYSKLLEDGLSVHGIEVELVKFGDVRHKKFRHLRYFLRVLKAARTADIIYALDAVSVGYPMMWAARIARKTFVVKIVGDYAWEQGRQRFGVTQPLDEFVKEEDVARELARFRRIQTSVAMRAERVVVPSEYLKNIVVAWGISNEKITVIHNAIALEEDADVLKEISALRRPIVVSVGRLVPWKGFDTLIDALADLRAKGMQASLAIVGDGPERELLEKRAVDGLHDGFFFTGPLSHAQTLATMKAADIFVLDSSYEGLSHVLIEAVMLGLPIVASDIGGNREVMTNEQNGLLVVPENPAALGSAIARLIADGELRARLAARAKERAADFSVDTMVQRAANLLKAL